MSLDDLTTVEFSNVSLAIDDSLEDGRSMIAVTGDGHAHAASGGEFVGFGELLAEMKSWISVPVEVMLP